MGSEAQGGIKIHSMLKFTEICFIVDIGGPLVQVPGRLVPFLVPLKILCEMHAKHATFYKTLA